MELAVLKNNQVLSDYPNIRFFVIGYLSNESKKNLAKWRREANLETIPLSSLHVTLLKSTVSHFTNMGRALIDNKLGQHDNIRLLELHQNLEFSLKPKWELFGNGKYLASRIVENQKLESLRNSIISKLLEEGMKRATIIVEENLHLTFAQKPFKTADGSKNYKIVPIDFPLHLDSIAFKGMKNPK